MAAISELPSENKLYCPIEQTWTISDEKLKEIKENQTGIQIYSENEEVKVVPHVNYYLNLEYKKLVSGSSAFFLYLHLSTSKTNSRIQAKYSFFIKSENYLTQFNNVFDDFGEDEDDTWGDEICNVQEFFDSRRKFVVDGKFTVKMKGMLIFDDVEIPKITIQNGALSQALWRKEHKDFKIIVKNEGNVLIHKYVLSARSAVFEAMYEAKREEAITNTLKIIDFNLKTVQTAVEYFYDQKIFEYITFDDAFELLRFADKYDITDLQEKLESHLTYHLSPSTVCQFVNGSVASNSINFRQICFNFMMLCLRHAIRVDKYSILDKDFAAELLEKTLSSAFN
uniref:BTB domain-containing protein n=1 Tax=Panagrolaimus sp. ES5 TaxID=591445 RepID=A0AC34FAW1_9BILA